ncbi:hypothetical protein [Enterococcus sp. HY326]|uniref:hypothetical protein n=1 Tax=Enterococcus sp. HY326 TaxID=2971265 RepID=UPI00223FE788|nr:hypothetical protein [Enterococcus sp. HY326]
MKKIAPPIMGWSSWNYFHQNINQEIIEQTAQALKNTGLLEAGYQYLNLDDCWQSSTRDINGNLQFDLINFPNPTQLIKNIHRLGLKIGLYSSCGRLTCEDLPASYTTEKQDAAQFINWDIDFLKYDYCHVIDLKSDEGWLPDAPDIYEIQLLETNTNEKTILKPSQGALGGAAEIVSEEKGQNLYLTGLSSNRGELIFENLDLPAGSYIVTIVYRKKKTEKRQLLEMIFNQTAVNVFFPTSSGWSNSGRQQEIITLSEPLKKLLVKNSVFDQKSDAILRYRTMANALRLAIDNSNNPEKNFNFAICEHGRTQPWTWANRIGNSYRIYPDIENSWQSIVECYQQALRVAKFAVEGSYADPDMLEIGNGQLTVNESIAHFTLWSFLSAPLVLGNDLRYLTKESSDFLKIVTNQEIIRINQSRPYLPAVLESAQNIDILIKYLDTQEIYLCFLNLTESDTNVTYSLDMLPEKVHHVKRKKRLNNPVEVWQQTDFKFSGNQLLFSLAPHSVKVFKL